MPGMFTLKNNFQAVMDENRKNQDARQSNTDDTDWTDKHGQGK
jgi:hypothetical protein